ncbi:MAG TPA: hypothetical protein VEK08_23385 [Planctomycetota bacterium]|nr:hypothetical protein [Planctomycetota bacterium]
MAAVREWALLHLAAAQVANPEAGAAVQEALAAAEKAAGAT